MTERKARLLFTLALAVSLASIGCGGGGPTFTPGEATTLIKLQWPESDLEVRSTSVDEQGRGVAVTRFNERMVTFFFLPAETSGWTLDAVELEGQFFYMADLQETQATMEFMGEVANALLAYKEANGTFPVGEGHDPLHLLAPDFMSGDADFNDAWGQELIYESDGDDYTMHSYGADQQEGTKDDINLHTGVFVGSEGQGGAQ